MTKYFYVLEHVLWDVDKRVILTIWDAGTEKYQTYQYPALIETLDGLGI